MRTLSGSTLSATQAPSLPGLRLLDSQVSGALVHRIKGTVKKPSGDIVAWRSYVDSLDWRAGNTKQDQTYRAALRAASLGVDEAECNAALSDKIVACGGDYQPAKVDRQVERAYEYVGAGSSESRPPTPRYDFDLEKLRSVADRVGPIDEAWLAARGSEAPGGIGPSDFLSRLYEPGERIVVFNDFRSQGQELWHHGCDLQRFEKGQPDGVWFLVQPVDGRRYPNPREGGKKSRRSEESVTSFRFIVLECDHEKQFPGVNALWLSALVQMPIRIVAIYTSGAKSIHALCRIDAASKQDWDRTKNSWLPVVLPLGADPGALSGVRLSRLPGCERGGEMQRLLYLNPAADGTPITELPERTTCP